MKKIKSIKYQVKLSYRNTFIFDDIDGASYFMSLAVKHAEDHQDIDCFELLPIVEYEEEVVPIYCDTDSLKEADKMKIKQQLNEEFGVASSDKAAGDAYIKFSVEEEAEDESN